MPAHDPHADQLGRALGAAFAHRRMAEEALLGQIGDDIAGRARQCDQQFAPFLAAQVERDRFFGPVEVFPAERAPLFGEHIAVVIEPARLVVDADHLRAHLRAIKPGGGRGDEARGFDDGEPLEEFVHA